MKNTFAALALGLLTTGAAVHGAHAVEIQQVVSSTGIEAWLVEDHSIPVIGLSIAFTGGASQDPAGKPGVANMLSGLLDEGAALLDSKAFQARLDELSVELSYDAGRDVFTGSLRTLTENLDEAAGLMKQSLRWPRFDDEPVERLRDQIISNIRRNARNPGRVAGARLMAAAFPDHPYGRPVDGTEQSVSEITGSDLEAFRRKTFARESLTVAAVGDIDAARLGEILDKVFGGLRIQPDLVSIADTKPVANEPIDIIMEVPQTNIRFIAPGLLRDDPEFIAGFVTTFILGGGGFGSRLFDEIREKRGLAYSVSAGLGAFDHAGIISGGTSTRADQAAEVVALIREEIQRFASEGPTEDELRKAKNYLIGSYPLRFRTSTGIARQLLYIQIDNLGIDYVLKRNDMIDALTIEDVSAAAARLFVGENLTIVRVGQPES
jgi:zinc protease